MDGNGYLEKATASRLAATKKVDELEAELARYKLEVAEWDVFIKRYEWLADPIGAAHGTMTKDSAIAASKPAKKVTVQAKSLAAAAAKLLEARVPLSTTELAELLRDDYVDKNGAPSQNFTSVVNSALWRRNEDLFEKKNGRWSLRTTDFTIIE